MLLRNFLFLDTKALGDYLSTLEGGIIEGTIDQTETGKRDKGAKLTAKIIEGNISSGSSVETKFKSSLTDAGNFQRLYELLAGADVPGNQLQVLDAFDEAIWDQLHRGEVLEVLATASLPSAFSMLNAMDDVAPLLDVMSVLGQDPLADPKTRTTFDGLRALGKGIEQKPIPLLLEALGASDFHFLANLPRQYLRVEVSELVGDVTLFGTIQRLIPRGQHQEAFSLIPTSLRNLPGTKPAEYQQQLSKMVESGTTNLLEGPAAVITPLAVYR
jgi:hypothetical protein